jgi:hypothetical protein
MLNYQMIPNGSSNDYAFCLAFKYRDGHGPSVRPRDQLRDRRPKMWGYQQTPNFDRSCCCYIYLHIGYISQSIVDQIMLKPIKFPLKRKNSVPISLLKLFFRYGDVHQKWHLNTCSFNDHCLVYPSCPSDCCL